MIDPSYFLFPSPKRTYDVETFPNELFFIPYDLTSASNDPEAHFPAIFLRYPEARFLILYFHANAEDLGRAYPFLKDLRNEFHSHVMAIEYPGSSVAHA
uniref:Uncharacterized protein n=1 Tax=Chromera velia CCMP2878 TaxID=1169474 RepID=A0A0K6S958_9ALVE|eukprot:Cvel_26743.t2-p1 / transcript=Cvel_26743.t2 / gene=Cvel_26743 / organism=Chromera_velia_CCMP2878 / gene_product=Alpha/beta hydrolase domain-containing protein 17A, putative / transcript_product=Alpha/beta hydrolase domain-containing protein 17A, putative / location=Cvel_scaffold3229:1290-1583(-) / protein_length=98 / sequence_SO=supercontig / SO=protein_coding / is_pseudo=false